MYKNIMQSIAGIEIYPIISLLIFFSLFTAVMIWFFRADKGYLSMMAELPFERNNHQDRI